MTRVITVKRAIKEAAERELLSRRRYLAGLCEGCGAEWTTDHECSPEHVAKCFEDVTVIG